MAFDIPTIEPVKHQAGTTFRFDRTLPDFPADLWTLAYAFRSHNASAAPIDITATADGTTHEINESSATTLTWLSGIYLLVGYVTDIATGLESHEVYRAAIEILPNVADNPTFEWRSYAQRMLDQIEATIAGSIARNDASYSINGRSFTPKTDHDLLAVRNYFRAEVARENNNGRQRKILTRFIPAR